MLRSLTLPVPYRRSRHFPVRAIANRSRRRRIQRMKSKKITSNHKHPQEPPGDDRLNSVCRGNISLLVPVVTLRLCHRLISACASGANFPKLICQKLCQIRQSKTEPDEVGHFDEECAAVAAAAGFLSLSFLLAHLHELERRQNNPGG